MKKTLFGTALMALIAGCAESELDSLSVTEQERGISFVADEPDTRIQWDYTGSYVPFWYAEKDRIGIFATNVKKGQFDMMTWVNENGASWSNLSGDNGMGSVGGKKANATYKATQSQRSGAFTAVSDKDLLHFVEGRQAHFLAVYPSTVNAEWKDGKIVLSALPALATQTQTTVKGHNEKILQYSLSVASKTNSYDAVGEKVNLSFKRPLSALVFSAANINEYTQGGSNSIFGNLKKIKVEAKGYTEQDNPSANIEPSKLTYDSQATLEVDTLEMGTTKITATLKAGGGGDEASAITLTLGDGSNGLEWNDEALAIIAINNIDRSSFSATKPETMEAVFSFDKIDLAVPATTPNSWRGFAPYPTLNINDFPYLVTKGASNTRTLIVNSGNFNDIFNKDGKIKWTEEGKTEVEVTEVKTIISNVALTDAEQAKLKNFTNLTELTLNRNTSIAANTFNQTMCQSMTKLVLPEVMTINKNFCGSDAFSELTELNLHSYKFADAAVNGKFFNDSEKTVLQKLDIHGVESMMPTFGIDRVLAFNNYTALEEVTMQDNVIVAPNAFKHCEKLKTVNGVLDITDADGAFEMSHQESDNGKNVLETIHITGTIIPSDAFAHCKKLKNVLLGAGNEQVAPTWVGTNGFQHTAIQYMDLSNAETLEANAFGNCDKFEGPKKGSQVLKVGVKVVTREVFSGTALKMVAFPNAEKIQNAIFKDCATLKQVWFGKKIEIDTEVWTGASPNTFGSTPTQVDLFLNGANRTDGLMTGTTMNTPDGSGGMTNPIQFHSVQYDKEPHYD